ncbi:MAG: translation initiation factor IF-2 [Planctomycetes bacterium]|nr:translation initiation factor IF-2 [Planctomycetota bacterium]
MKISELAKSLGYKANEFVGFVHALNIGITLTGKDIPFNISQAIRQKVPHIKNLDKNQLAILNNIKNSAENEAAEKEKKAEEKKAKQVAAKEEAKQKTQIKTLSKMIKKAAKPKKETEEKRNTELEKQKATQLQPQVIIEEIQTKEKKKRDELRENILNVKEKLLNVKTMGNVNIDYQHDKDLGGVGKLSEYRTGAKYLRKQVRKKPQFRPKRPDEEQKPQVIPPKPSKPTKFTVTVPINIKDFSLMSGIKIQNALSTLRKSNRFITSDSMLTEDDVVLLGLENKIDITTQKIVTQEDQLLRGIKKDAKVGITRPPVVTIMGHVDHGKTTLLDYIRKTHVAQKEAGGITQHIGATQVTLPNGKKITFIDTPGHEAFTSMRARGANATDIVILVVAADEGVMPQTMEALNHAKAAGPQVSIMVAINKMDKPGAQPDRIKNELSKQGLIPEEWSGSTIYASVSAVTGLNVETLLEMILLQAEMLDLKADPNAIPQGLVLESSKSDREGPKATLLVQNGTLKKGDIIIAGEVSGKVRDMLDHNKKSISTAPPSTPIEVMGLGDVPKPGDKFMKVSSVQVATDIVKERKGNSAAPAKDATKSLSDLLSEKKEIKIILKCDNKGSIEAIINAAGKVTKSNIDVKIIHADVGKVTESDALLATASNACILTFNSGIDSKAEALTKNKKIPVKHFNIIYDLVDEIEKLVKGEIKPEMKLELVGEVLVKQVFKISKLGTIAGCYIQKGKAIRNSPCKVKRNNKIIHEGKVSSLKRFKDDAKEVQEKFECGIGVSNFDDFNEGDIIEIYSEVEVAPAVH